jgi:hypothetical protein
MKKTVLNISQLFKSKLSLLDFIIAAVSKEPASMAVCLDRLILIDNGCLGDYFHISHCDYIVNIFSTGHIFVYMRLAI